MPQMDVIASFRFTVEIDGQRIGAFTECDLPSFEIETEQVKDGGNNNYIHNIPGRGKPSNLTLKHGLVLNDKLLAWAYGSMMNALPATEMYRSVGVVVCNVNGKPIYRFDLERAFPIKWSGPSLRAGENAVAIETLELAHHGVSFAYMPDGAT